LNPLVEIQYIRNINFRGTKVLPIIKFPFTLITFLLTLGILLLPSESQAQNNLRIFEVPGGGRGTTQTEDSDNNTTAIYIVGGLVVAGILAYALFFKEKKNDTDTAASLNSNLIYSEINDVDTFNENMQEFKDKIPVDFFLGVRNNEAVLNDKTYSLGVRVKL
jgi:hypothetical protein